MVAQEPRSKAVRAAVTAASTSSAVALATWASRWPVAGSITSRTPSLLAGRQRPPISSCSGAVVLVAISPLKVVGRYAAVHHQRRPIGPGGLVRGQVDRQADHVLRPSEPPHRDAGQPDPLLGLVLQQVAHQRGLYGARTDGVR